MDILQRPEYRPKLPGYLRISYWTDLILLFYVFSMPFTSAFALTPVLPIPLIFCAFLFFLMLLQIINSKRFPNGFLGFDLIFVMCFLIFVVLSYLVNGRGVSKSLHHTLAYLSTFLLFYISVKFALFNSRNKQFLFKKVLVVLTWTIFISSVYVIVEFIFGNLLNININDYIPRPTEASTFYQGTVLAVFYRTRGFAAESGHFTFMIELLAPVAFYYLYFSGYCQWKRIFKTLYLFLVIFGFISAFSIASFIIVPIAIAVSSILYARPILYFVKKNATAFFISAFVVILIFVAINFVFPIFKFILLSIQAKLGGYGYEYREDNLSFFFTHFSRFDITQKLIGAGPAGTVLLGFGTGHGILNIYFSFIFEIGLIGFLFFILLLIYGAYHIYKMRSSLGFLLSISLLAGMMHYYFIANYYYPWFWFILILSIFCGKGYHSSQEKPVS